MDIIANAIISVALLIFIDRELHNKKGGEK